MENAPRQISVPERPPSVNPTEPGINAHQARAAARICVITDTRLSPGARLLYVLLDDYGRLHGQAWPRQTTLAARLGCSEVWIRHQLRELEAASYITKARGQRGVRYLLYWNPDRKRGFGPTESAVSVGAPASLYETRQEARTTTTAAFSCPPDGQSASEDVAVDDLRSARDLLFWAAAAL